MRLEENGRIHGQLISLDEEERDGTGTKVGL